MISADIVVIGAGPAGLAAAATAAQSGSSVLLVDERSAPGGQIWRGTASRAAASWLARIEAQRVRTSFETAIVDVDAPHGMYGMRGTHPLRIEAGRAVVLATGARELFLPFPGWTLPNVVGVGGAQALLKSGWNVRGRKAVVAGTGPLLLPVAAALARAGARVEAVIEQAPRHAVARFAANLWRTPRRLGEALRYRLSFARTPYITGSWVVHARGDGVVREAVVTDGASERVIGCDILCTAYGLVPAVELPLLFGCALDRERVVVDELQRTSVDGVFCAGEVAGIAGKDAAIVEGTIAGLAATGRITEAKRLVRARSAYADMAARMNEAFALRPELKQVAGDDTVVCRCEDVSLGMIVGCSALREARVLARVGMGPCQGRVCGPALRQIFGWEREGVRPPLLPVTIEALATFGDTATEQT